MPITTLSIVEADLASAQLALDNSRVSAWFASSLNVNSAVWTTDSESDTEFDLDGTFNGTIGGRVLRFNFPSRITDLAVEILDSAGITADTEKVTRKGREQPQDRTNAHLVGAGRRRPGSIWESYGTLTGDGASAAQQIGTTAVAIDQWSGSQDLINITLEPDGFTFTVITPGDYQLDFHIFIDPSQAPGTEWTYSAAVDSEPISDSVSSRGGSVRGTFDLPAMTAGQQIILTAKADASDKTLAIKDKTVLQFTRIS